MTTSNIAAVLKVSPNLYDIINLPVGQLSAYMAATTTIGVVYHIGVVRAIRWARRKAGFGGICEIRDETPNLRFLISTGMKSALTYAASFFFEAMYIRFPVLPKIVAGVVWGSRKLVGLPGDAPYGEYSGGGPVANVLEVTFELERLFCTFVPFPVLGSLGLGVKGLTADQITEVFKPLAPTASDLPLRFMTPYRLVRIAMQVGFATAVGGLVNRYIVPKIIGAPNQLKKPTYLPTYLACPLMFLTSLAIIRDSESISFLGSRFRLDITGLALLLLPPSSMLMEVLEAYFTNPAPASERESIKAIESVTAVILSDLPIHLMSMEEAGEVQENLLHKIMKAIYYGDRRIERIAPGDFQPDHLYHRGYGVHDDRPMHPRSPLPRNLLGTQLHRQIATTQQRSYQCGPPCYPVDALPFLIFEPFQEIIKKLRGGMKRMKN